MHQRDWLDNGVLLVKDDQRQLLMLHDHGVELVQQMGVGAIAGPLTSGGNGPRRQIAG